MLKVRCSVSSSTCSRCLGWPLLAPGRGSGRKSCCFLNDLAHQAVLQPRRAATAQAQLESRLRGAMGFPDRQAQPQLLTAH